MSWTALDERGMQRALDEAKLAALRGETPIGAALMYEDELLCSAGNIREAAQNPLGHAELIVIQEGAKKLKTWRLEGCTLYVTLEPCMMCAGAIYQARIPRLVFGASDPKAGFVHSQGRLLDHYSLNHHVDWTCGLFAEESSALLKQFFQDLRARAKRERQAKREMALREMALEEE